MKIAIHQPNFCPWFPYFYKMALADKFIILRWVQFEKNGFQNRFNIKDKWVTKPVKQGMESIFNKEFTSGRSLYETNLLWIYAIKETLDIDTEVIEEPENFNVPYTDKTQRLIDLIKHFGGDTYITNPVAKDKYLNEDLMRASGIKIEYCHVPKHLNRHTFEILTEMGIETAIKNLPKRAYATS